MMEMTGLPEDDLDGEVFEEEEVPPLESIKWMALAKVHKEKPYNQFWFFKTTRATWDLA